MKNAWKLIVTNINWLVVGKLKLILALISKPWTMNMNMNMNIENKNDVGYSTKLKSNDTWTQNSDSSVAQKGSTLTSQLNFKKLP